MYKIKEIITGSIIFVLLVILVGYYFKESTINTNRSDTFTNTKNIPHYPPYPPYITQSLYINIYATNEDFPKYEWLFKGALNNNIMVANGTNNVFVPKTTISIPVRVYKNSPQTKFSIQANGIEQEIQECDFIATTF